MIAFNFKFAVGWLIVALTFGLLEPVHAQSLQLRGTNTVSLLSHVPLPSSDISDVWGYFDEETGREFALVGYGIFQDPIAPGRAGFFLVEVTDPVNSKVVAQVDTLVPGFDVKVWQHYVYTVNGRQDGTGGIVDISDPENPKKVGTMPTAHNIFIDDRGFMYLEFPGLRILDLREDPTQPRIIFEGGTEGHDATVQGNVLFDFHGSAGTNLYDVTDPFSPSLISRIAPPTIVFHHSGWPTEDGQFLYICDELAHFAQEVTPDVTIWNISDPENPFQVGESIVDTNATVHNLYIIGDYAFTSYYTAGFRVFDISDPERPVLVGEFDTDPNRSGEGFSGAFGCYPFAPSRNIYVSDITQGLFVFQFEPFTTDVDADGVPQTPTGFALLDNFPNPFNPSTTIVYEIPHRAHVQLRIFDLRGRVVRTLVDAPQSSGTYEVRWDGRDEAQVLVPSGVYVYRLQTEQFSESKRMLFLK